MKDTSKEIFRILFSLRKTRSMLKNCIFVKKEFIQINFLTTFWTLREHSSGRIPLDDNVCMSWFININTARFLKRTQNSPTYEKTQIHGSLKNRNDTLNLVWHLQVKSIRNKMSIKKSKVEDSIQKQEKFGRK